MHKLEFFLDVLAKNNNCISEYELLTLIDKSGADFFPPDENLSLYKKHFYLFHQLYQFNEHLLKNNQCIIISALEIRLCSTNEITKDIGRVDGLKVFYLDENNLNLSEEEIAQMMQLFWKKYMAVDKKSAALKILGLENQFELNREIVKKRYNQLAKEHHPDKGGDEVSFIKINNAYNELKLIY